MNKTNVTVSSSDALKAINEKLESITKHRENKPSTLTEQQYAWLAMYWSKTIEEAAAKSCDRMFDEWLKENPMKKRTFFADREWIESEKEKKRNEIINAKGLRTMGSPSKESSLWIKASVDEIRNNIPDFMDGVILFYGDNPIEHLAEITYKNNSELLSDWVDERDNNYRKEKGLQYLAKMCEISDSINLTSDDFEMIYL